MYLSTLQLQHFRNHIKRSMSFNKNTTAIIGENAQGKTNILEAISLLSIGNSFRAQLIEEMVQWKQEVGRVKAECVDGGSAEDHTFEIEVVLTTGMVQGERVQKRRFLLDGVAKQKKDVVGRLTTTLFRPEDLDMISGSPSGRRAFLNQVLSQVSREYRESLSSYEKALARRNALLDVLRERNTTRASFAFWDQLMVKHGNVLTQKRRELIEFLNKQHEVPMKFRIEYDHSAISEDRLRQYAIEEVAAGHTLVGPHKDEFRVFLENGDGQVDGKELSSFGSRGEQRMAVLWLKIGELAFCEDQTKARPILLLDDIFSELDQKHKEMVLELVGKQQTIITTTPTTLPEKELAKMGMIEL